VAIVVSEVSVVLLLLNQKFGSGLLNFLTLLTTKISLKTSALLQKLENHVEINPNSVISCYLLKSLASML